MCPAAPLSGHSLPAHLIDVGKKDDSRKPSRFEKVFSRACNLLVGGLSAESVQPPLGRPHAPPSCFTADVRTISRANLSHPAAQSAPPQSADNTTKYDSPCRARQILRESIHQMQNEITEAQSVFVFILHSALCISLTLPRSRRYPPAAKSSAADPAPFPVPLRRAVFFPSPPAEPSCRS